MVLHGDCVIHVFRAVSAKRNRYAVEPRANNRDEALGEL